MGQDQAGGAGFGRGRGGPTDEEREAERKRRLEERKYLKSMKSESQIFKKR